MKIGLALYVAPNGAWRGQGLVGAFFATIFELNAVCLRYIDASKESVAALPGMQDRLEALRNLAFAPDPTGSDLANTTYLKSLMVTPANGSDFAKTKPIEVITIKAYNTSTKSTSGVGIQITRPAGANVTPSIDLNSLMLPVPAVVLVNVKYQWNMLGDRPCIPGAPTQFLSFAFQCHRQIDIFRADRPLHSLPAVVGAGRC